MSCWFSGQCLVSVFGVGESCSQCVMLILWSVVSVCGVGESARDQCVMLVIWSVSCVGLWCRGVLSRSVCHVGSLVSVLHWSVIRVLSW